MIDFARLDNRLQLHADDYAKLRGYSPGLAQKLVDIMGLNEKTRLLDIGCGTGKNTSLVAGISSCFAIGIDIDEDRINFAKQLNPHIHWQISDAHCLPFRKDEFTAIEIILAFQRFNDQHQVLKEAFRVLKSKGKIAIATVAPKQLKDRLDFKFFPEALELELQRFTETSLITSILNGAGFSKITINQYSEPFMPADSQWIQWMAERPYSSFRQISDNNFKKGLQKLHLYLTALNKPVTIFNEATIIIAEKI